ncbi:hypothetical protein MBRA1_003345 [Malassezia brasiliensis]|uniref:HCNGP-like protein n=1 Tax=Malassezia brasiliensis TaxID=1821822 RepID=A0AAF0DWI7_9BASI|nr:hypothetical protein MBRA1_003345 [Malassezia brasiliensis]
MPRREPPRAVPAPGASGASGAPEVTICGVAARAARTDAPAPASGAPEATDEHAARSPQAAAAAHTASPAGVSEYCGATQETPPMHAESAPPPAGSTVAACFLPPADANGDANWGLGRPVAHGADPALSAKLAHFHALKAQGTHFNATLARNRSFHNPHIYEKLVKWADLDETGSNFAAVAHSTHTPPLWDNAQPDVLRDGDIVALGTSPAHPAKAQKAYVDAHEARRVSQRDRIDFAPARRDARSSHERSHRR